jgi:hypothetical protein
MMPGFMEESTAVSPSALTPDTLRPFVEGCGYVGARLAVDYPLGSRVVPLAGFYGQPLDARSACLAVVSANGDGKAAAAWCADLGAPTALVCAGDALEWWALSADGPSQSRRFPATQIDGFFREHKDDLSPEAIYASKMRRPIRTAQQMWFVDVGLMPAVERRAGEALRRLVEEAIQRLAKRLGGQFRNKKKSFADLYKTVFWLLAAKLLNEKGVENFRRIDLTDVDVVFERVGRHYADIDDLPPGGRAWRPAIDEVAGAVAKWGHLGNTSAEALAYVYETALVDHDIREELGIHSTPPVLVDYMLSQLWPMVEQVNVESRRVFEPACGPATFLIAAMRWLRDFSGIENGKARHRYLLDRVRGIELELFAWQLARLQLTLADVPHGNSWRIDEADMFMPGVLRKAASACTLLLANPPYEEFKPRQRSKYRQAGEEVTARTKAVEMLKRTLPGLPPGAVFGVVMPQGVLHDKESRPVREFLLKHCELSEIAVFADNLFEHGDHEVAVLMGRRRSAAPPRGTLMYRRVRERGMEAFKERLAFSSEETVELARFARSPTADLRVPELDAVWKYLSPYPTLNDLATLGQGLSHKGQDLPRGAWTIHEPPCENDELGYAHVPGGLMICGLPPLVGINLKKAAVLAFRAGRPPGRPQVLLNYARVSREPWLLKATLDEYGRATTSRFVSVRPKGSQVSVLHVWALLNSPVANAFAFCRTPRRYIPPRTMQEMPVPRWSPEHAARIEQAALRYRQVTASPGALFYAASTPEGVWQALREMDAAVLQAYDLPPRLERQLLDLFAGVERKGVGGDFRGYYPPGLTAYVPLHELISEDYARSTLGRFRQSHQPETSREVLAALRTASAAYGEE